ncbi:unnamed protein product, partial [Allacma fusca]
MTLNHKVSDRITSMGQSSDGNESSHDIVTIKENPVTKVAIQTDFMELKKCWIFMQRSCIFHSRRARSLPGLLQRHQPLNFRCAVPLPKCHFHRWNCDGWYFIRFGCERWASARKNDSQEQGSHFAHHLRMRLFKISTG